MNEKTKNAHYQAAYRERRLERKKRAIQLLWDLRSSVISYEMKMKITEIIDEVERLN